MKIEELSWKPKINSYRRLMKEIWKKVIDYEDCYEISNLGRLRSKDRLIKNCQGEYLKRGTIIKLTKCTNGYLEYILHRDGKIKVFLVHRLVAKHFLPNPNNLPQINHLDENITNNRIDNLQWCTPKENANYGTRNQRCKQNNIKQQKPIIQLDLKGNKIKEYATIGDASREIN